MPIPANPKKLKSLLAIGLKKDIAQGVVHSCLNRRVPIHFGSVSDPFQHIEKKYRISYELLKVLHQYNYPTVISTKGTIVSSSEYLEIIKDFPVVVQNSFSTFNEELAAKIEPYAPSPKERLLSLEKLAKSGIWTTIRLQPFLYPITSIDEINFESLANIGIKHVVLEHLRIPTNSRKELREQFFDAIGMNMLEEYKRLGLQYSRINFELASKVKLDNILKAKEKVNKLGMTFGSADNDYHHISDTPCCCGLPDNDAFSNFYKGNIGYSMYQSMKLNYINFKNIDNQWQPEGSISEFINSDGRDKQIRTTSEFLQKKISIPHSSNSPDSYAGISFDDEKGYIIENEFRNKFYRNGE
jgi:DNA repair photolyase